MKSTKYTGQSIYSLGKVPIEILPGKRHITWVLAMLFFSAEFQMEPLAPNVIHYYILAKKQYWTKTQPKPT